MTIVVALPLFHKVIVVADSRVSWEGRSEKDDILQKIYQVGDRMIIGFSGPPDGAYPIFKAIGENEKTYSGTNLFRDVEGWIRREYRRVEAKYQRYLSFVLVQVKRQTLNINKFPPDMLKYQIIMLEPNRSKPGELQCRRDRFPVIGSGGQELNAIRNIFQEFYSFVDVSFQFRNSHIHAWAIVDELIRHFMAKKPDTVGGLFQCATLNAEGIQWLSYGSAGGVSLEFTDGRYFIVRKDAQEKVKLMTVIEWGEISPRPTPGGIGVFEDPVYRRVFGKATNSPGSKRGK
jgi:hypothetical protein